MKSFLRITCALYLMGVCSLYANPFLFHEAAAQGNLDLVKTLYQTPKDLTQFNEQGYTVLYKAAQSGNLEVVRFLVDNGADVNSANRFDCVNREDTKATPLHIAARKGYLDIIRFLYSRGANLDPRSTRGFKKNVPLMEAARQGRQEVVQFLVNRIYNQRDSY